jgi:hypothetical protein
MVINGTNSGVYSYIQVTDSPIGGTGAVVLGGHLVVSSPFAPPIGTLFYVVDNHGTNTVSGTFAGLPEGSIITANNSSYAISYHGGDGNDVTLTAVPPSPAIPAFDARAIVMLIALLAMTGTMASRSSA